MPFTRFVVEVCFQTLPSGDWQVDMVLRTTSSALRRQALLPLASGTKNERFGPDAYLELVDSVGELLDQGVNSIGGMY